MCDIGVGNVSLSVMITTNPDDSLITATHGSNQTLHNTLWNVLPHMLQCRNRLWKCLEWWILPEHSMVQCILWIFHWVKIRRTGRLKAISGRNGAAETPD